MHLKNRSTGRTEINDAEQYSRKTSIRFRGLQVSDKNDVTNSELKSFQSILNLNFRNEDIVIAHPLPMKGRSPGGNHPAPPSIILVEFLGDNHKGKVIRE